VAAQAQGTVMTGTRVAILAGVVAMLIALALILNSNRSDGPASEGRPLLQNFASQANEAQQISIVRKENDPIIIRRETDKWVVANRDNYPANVSKLRQIIGALANAKILEEKTSNPDLYEKLEVGDPEDGGSGTRVSIDGDGFSYSVVVGKQVQGDRRYVRVAGSEVSYLIDQNPNIPQNIRGLLVPDILNIDTKRVRKMIIRHDDDDETVIIEKTAEDLSDFAVLDIPEGRELKYATVANGMAGVLSDLDLEDVRAAVESNAVASAIIQTWDGLRISVEISTDSEASWLTFSA